jgi:ABC-type glycerol-3-phosphate transport system substrate-binding protein
MKKLTFILALGVALTLTACGSGSAATETTDSTMAPVADTTAVVADSTVAPVEGGVSKDAEKPVSNEAVK